MANMDPTTPLGYQVANPRVIIADAQANVLVDSAVPGLSLDSFSYTFSEDGPDEASITFSLSDVEQFDIAIFKKYQSLLLYWGYLHYMREPIKVLITKISENYSPTGLTLNIACTDDFSVLTQGKNPILLKAENLKQYLQSVQDMGLVVEALKAKENDRTAIWYPKTNEYLEVDCILSPFEIALLNPKKEKRPFNLDRQPQGYEYTDYNSWAPLTLSDKIKRVLEYNAGNAYDNETVAGAAAATSTKPWITQTGSDGVKRKLTELEYSEFFGVDPQTEGEGQTVKEVVSDLLSKSKTDKWTVTGHNGKLVIHNRNTKHSPSREYTWAEEGGFLLSLTASTDSHYNNTDNAFSKLAIDPETGALTLKDFMDKDETAIDANTEQQHTLRSGEARGIDMMLASNEFNSVASIYDDEGLIQRGIVQLPPVDMTSTWSKDSYGQFHQAVDNASGGLRPQFVIALPVIEELKGNLDESIKSMKTSGSSSRLKVSATILGDPYIACTENITLKGISKKYQGKYHITSCTHNFNKNGYTVSLEMYPVATLPSSVTTIEAKHTKEEMVEKLEKSNCGVNGIPVISSGNVLIDRLPKKKYTIYYHDVNGQERSKVVLSNKDPIPALKIMGLTDLNEILPGISPIDRPNIISK